MDKAPTLGLMVKNMWEAGKRANSMGRLLYIILKDKANLAFGKMEKESSGLKNRHKI